MVEAMGKADKNGLRNGLHRDHPDSHTNDKGGSHDRPHVREPEISSFSAMFTYYGYAILIMVQCVCMEPVVFLTIN